MVSSKILPRSKRGFWEEHVSLKAVQSSSNMSKNFINDALVSFIFISRASCQLQQLIFWRPLINWPTLKLSKFRLYISFFFLWGVCFSGKLRNCARRSDIFVTMLPERVSVLASAEKIYQLMFPIVVLFLLEKLFVELEKLNRFYQENLRC